LARLAVAFPILHGKEEDWQRFRDQLRGPRKQEFIESRRRLHVREVTFHQKTPVIELVIITLEGDAPGLAFINFASANDDFTNWFVEQVKELHGIDLRQPSTGGPPEEFIDSGALTDVNKSVVRRFVHEVLNAHDADAAPEIFASNYQNHFPGAPAALDLDDTKATLATSFSAFPDLHVALGSLFAEGHMIATRMTITGTHLGEFQGIPATGRKVSISASPQWRVAGGQITEDWPSFDRLSLLEQLRAIPEAEGSARVGVCRP
jgi:predicted ester cyclase